jgi:glucose 1-dehydrogenase
VTGCQRLQGRHALITGASRGIGRAVAVRFAAEGATVAINYAGAGKAAEESLEQARAASRDAGFPADGHRWSRPTSATRRPWRRCSRTR